MLNSLTDLLHALRDPPSGEAAAADNRALQLATAVLLIEVMRADTDLSAVERHTAIDALHAQFRFSDDEVARLLELAEQTARTANDFYSFTSRINERFDMPAKLTMIEHLWRVAFADGVLGAHENHVMRKIAGLLYIPQGAFVNAKARARAATQP